MSALSVDELDHLVINVRDVDQSAGWYCRVLGMRRDSFAPAEGAAPRTALRFGERKINLRPLEASTEAWFTAARPEAGTQDLCFLTTAAPAQVVAHLEACGVPVVEGPVVKQGARGRLLSVYCRDPDGSLIEIASYAKNSS